MARLERDANSMPLVEQARAAAELKAAADNVRSKFRIAVAGIYVPPGVPVDPSTSDILALDRAVQELKKAAGIRAA